MRIAVALLLILFVTFGCTSSSGVGRPKAEVAINAELDDFHQAASAADEERYFRHFAPDGVFLGTDATERWTKPEFREYAHPYFSKGKGWTFTPTVRHVAVSSRGNVAWFDERLDSTSYGECRGSGVLEKIDGRWKVQQYNLTIPIPNDLAQELVGRIREYANPNPK